MNLDVQFKLNSNSNYRKYLRENSYWYKKLNRQPELFASFDAEMRESYKLRITDKIGNVVDKIELAQMFINGLK